ncbi:FG-GAP-like repeat-containing protein [Haliangium sp.]|uniref:FG-GAP-like repeat-containing protein n=1 Tax=Haliangium sp. TaxID=2663208 RepID=UPI003D0DAD54
MQNLIKISLSCAAAVVLSASAAVAQSPIYRPPIASDVVEAMARGSQFPHGEYDSDSNRTFVVYPGCGGEDPCPSDPYLMYFDHDDQAWSSPLKLGNSPTPVDAHYYPQVVITDDQRVHVFHGLHAEDPIRHYRSRYTSGDDRLATAAGWELISFTFSPPVDADTLELTFNRATYPLPVLTLDGTLFLIYRNTIKSQPTNMGDWYEVVFYTYSLDDGVTWVPPRQLIVPTTAASCQSGAPVCDDEEEDDDGNVEEWDAAVLAGSYFQRSDSLLHLLFSVSKHKNVYIDKTYYAVMDLDLDASGWPRILTPTGADLGAFIDQDEMNDVDNQLIAYELGGEIPSDRSGVRAIIGADHEGRPHLFYKRGPVPVNPQPGDVPVQLLHRRWDGNAWTTPVCLRGREQGCDEISDTAIPQDVEFYDDGSYDVYVLDCILASGQCEQLRMHKSPYHSGWSESVLHANGQGAFYNFMTPVRRYHPDHKSTFFEVHYTNWQNPRPTGKLFTAPAGNDVVVVQKYASGITNTRVRLLYGDKNFTRGSSWFNTALPRTGSDLAWTYAYGDYNRDGKNDLYVFKRTNTGSNTTEVHVLDGAHDFDRFLVNTATALPETGTDRSWEFELGDYNGDSRLDVYAIKRANTGSGRTEVHILDGATNFSRFLLQTSTPLELTGTSLKWQFSVADYDRDNKPDVFAIKRSETGSGKLEVHILDGAANYGTWLMQVPTVLAAVGTSGIWTFEVGDDNRDRVPDLYAIKRSQTSSGQTHVIVLDGATQYSSRMLGTRTALGPTGSTDRWVYLIGNGPDRAP